MVSFSEAPSAVLSLGLMAIISAAVTIALIAFRNGSTDATANTSITSGVTGISNFTGQLGTVGTMLGISLVLVVILSVFGFGRGKGGL